MDRLTVFGHTGYIGSSIVNYCRNIEKELILPKRGQIPNKKLGDVIYAVGITNGFVQRPGETLDAHVCYLRKILEKGNFESFVYLSSTRVYNNLSKCGVDERTFLEVNPLEPSEIYNISKLMGENLCISFQKKNTKILRLSNVFGGNMSNKNFLGNILDQASNSTHVLINQTRDSGKDYISIDDVIFYLLSIMESGSNVIYNIASGKNVLHYEIASILEKEGINVEFTNLSKRSLPPIISNKVICQEYGSPRYDVKDYIEKAIIRNRII